MIGPGIDLSPGFNAAARYDINIRIPNVKMIKPLEPSSWSVYSVRILMMGAGSISKFLTIVSDTIFLTLAKLRL
jgi:hypothetical protein